MNAEYNQYDTTATFKTGGFRPLQVSSRTSVSEKIPKCRPSIYSLSKRRKVFTIFISQHTKGFNSTSQCLTQCNHIPAVFHRQ